jgi:pimeloyl-ACP methyl ester carboxylesterase
MSLSTSVTSRRIIVDDIDLFYREAGPKNVPVVILLHGTLKQC